MNIETNYNSINTHPPDSEIEPPRIADKLNENTEMVHVVKDILENPIVTKNINPEKTRKFSAKVKKKFTLINSSWDEKLTKVATFIFSKYSSIKFSTLTLAGRKVEKVDLDSPSSVKKIKYIKTAINVTIVAFSIILLIIMLPLAVTPSVVVVAKLASELGKSIYDLKKAFDGLSEEEMEEDAPKKQKIESTSKEQVILIAEIVEDKKTPEIANEKLVETNLQSEDLNTVQTQAIPVPSDPSQITEMASEEPEPAKLERKDADAKNNRLPKVNNSEASSKTTEDIQSRAARRANIILGHYRPRPDARPIPKPSL